MKPIGGCASDSDPLPPTQEVALKPAECCTPYAMVFKLVQEATVPQAVEGLGEVKEADVG